jgi:hypothetical protein
MPRELIYKRPGKTVEWTKSKISKVNNSKE